MKALQELVPNSNKVLYDLLVHLQLEVTPLCVSMMFS
jgi:hypothetical protein